VWSYGNGAQGRPITESTPRQPFAAARERAILLEEIARQTRHPWMEFCLPSFVYGAIGPLADLAASFRQGGSRDILDDERVKWSLIERLDLGRAYLALLQHGRGGEHFVVAEDQAISIAEFYETVAAHVGNGQVRRRSHEELSRTVDREALERMSTSQLVDATHFKQRTGWRPRENFAATAPRFLAAP